MTATVPIRIAHITTTAMSLECLLRSQLKRIRDEGYEVFAVSAPADDFPFEGTEVQHVLLPITRGARSPIGDLVALARLIWILRRKRIDVVHTHMPKTGLIGQYAALFAGVPLRVHTIHGLYFPGFMKPWQRRMYVLLERMTMQFSHHNFSQNPEDVPVAIAENICHPDRIEVIGNGIDLDRFYPGCVSEREARRIRERLGIASDAPVVGMVARLCAEKGYLELFRAAAELRKRYPDIRFILLGREEPEKHDSITPRDLDRYGIRDVCLPLGHQPFVERFYALMDMLVLPSHREGFPRAPMEASAMGIPCVVSDVRGCRQTVDHNRTGLVVPARDSEALANAMDQLLGDRELRRRMGRAAREKAEREFDEKNVNTRIVSAYARLLSTHRPAGKMSVAAAGPSSVDN